jgi:cytochrome P450
MITRHTADWVTILGEKIPPGTRIIVPIWLLHRHPDYWSEPESFKPERWLNSGQAERKFQPFAYLPFSAGSRNCIGQRFAMWEAKLILAPIIRDFEIKLSPSLEDVELKIVNFITIKSIPSIKILAKPRQ